MTVVYHVYIFVCCGYYCSALGGGLRIYAAPPRLNECHEVGHVGVECLGVEHHRVGHLGVGHLGVGHPLGASTANLCV